jgi:serine/threonine protein kinase
VEKPKQSEKIKKIVGAALEKGASERSAFLEAACGQDAELRAEVESLVAAYEASEQQSEHSRIRQLAGIAETRSIGPYKLLKKLGEGGMGQVWLAEQTAPVRRQVALKLIRAGMYEEATFQRFQSEQQSLAMMEHPAIAKVFDAGTTPSGQPYFAMEYIEGFPITTYCDQKRLGIRERLELFVQVCEGVQHAHQKAIIHRDLKPANILVVEIDGKPMPRLIDFGLSKATSPTVARETLFTQLGAFLGTPGYMSPEQADPGVLDVDTRSDVYSLGVVLYELLTGSLPFDSAVWKKLRLEEVLRQLREEEPARPSMKVTADRETSTSRASARGTVPARLAGVLRGDLDWITLKAVEKERERRYGTPNELAEDVRHYLKNEPVQAHPASVWYRGSKFLRRYRVAVAAGALVVGSLAAGLYLANRERAIAQRRFQDVRELANKLFEIDAQARELPGSTKTRQLIVNTSLEYLQRLSADVRGDPGLALEVGNAYMRVARVQGVPISPTLGQSDQAEKNLKNAEGFIQLALKAQPANRTAMLRAAQIAHDRMILARFAGRPEESLDLAKQSAGWLEKYHAGKGDEAESSAILNTYLNVADQFESQDEFDEALRLCSRASEIANTFNRPAQRGNFLWVSARIFQKRGDLDQALSAIQESVKLLDPGPDWLTQGGQGGNFRLALVYEGKILGEDNSVNLGRPEEAVQALERAFQMADTLVHRDPNDHASRGSLATAGIPLGDILRHSDPQRALDIYDHTLRHLAETPGDRHLQRYEVNLWAGSSYPLRRQGHGSEATRRVEKAIERLKQLKMYPEDKTDLGSETEETIRALADDEASKGNLPGAIETYRTLLEKVEPKESDPEFNVEDAVHLSTICTAAANLYRRVGNAEQASKLEERRQKIWQQWDRKLPNNSFVHRQLTTKPAS